MQRRIRLPPNSSSQGPFLCGLTPAQLQRISDEFGPLSEIGRKRLYLRVIQAVQTSWFARLGKGTAASKLAESFHSIEDKANELLSLLVAAPNASKKSPNSDLFGALGFQIACVLIEEGTNNWILQEILKVVAPEGWVVGGVPWQAGELPIGVTAGGSLNLIRMALTMLAEAASRARAKASAAVSHGRGGARRRGRTPASLLALDLIAIYCELRRRYPHSGQVPGYSPGGPLPRFIFAVFAAMTENDPDVRPIRDTSIGDLFYELRKSNDTTN
jgi:hypothetical protein